MIKSSHGKDKNRKPQFLGVFLVRGLAFHGRISPSLFLEGSVGDLALALLHRPRRECIRRKIKIRKERKIYVVRPEVGDDTTESFSQPDIHKQKNAGSVIDRNGAVLISSYYRSFHDHPLVLRLHRRRRHRFRHRSDSREKLSSKGRFADEKLILPAFFVFKARSFFNFLLLFLGEKGGIFADLSSEKHY